MKKIMNWIFLCCALWSLSASGTNQIPIRIGVNAWPPCEIWYVAQQFFDTPVQIIRFSTWSDNVASLYKGEVDITHATYLSAIYHADKGEGGKIILATDFIKGADGLVIKPALKRGQNLKGKKIAVEINSDEHFLLTKALQSFGLTEADVKLISSTSAQAAELFIKGEADACFTYEPFLSKAAKRGDGLIVWTATNPKFSSDVLVARSDIIKTRKKALKNILAAWYKGQAYIQENPDTAFKIMAAKENMNPKAFETFYNRFTFFSANENRKMFKSPSFFEKLKEINEFLFSHGAIKEKALVSDMFTAEIIGN